jgi:hypothetical protein
LKLEVTVAKFSLKVSVINSYYAIKPPSKQFASSECNEKKERKERKVGEKVLVCDLNRN